MNFDPQTEGYTDDEKVLFDNWISNNNKLSMYVYFQIALPTKFTDLYHSFGKGKKGYYQDIIDNLIRQGEAEFNSWLNEYQDVGEVESKVNQMVYQLIKDRAV